MEKFVTKNSLYLVGSLKDVLEEIRRLSKEYNTVLDCINVYLN
jgi:hypothetical protein